MSQTTDATTPIASRGSLAIIFLIVFIDLLGFGMVIPLLPIYADQFAVHPRGWELGLLMASFSAMQFVFAPIWGRVSDHLGRRPVLLVGLFGSVVFYSLFAYATIQESLTLLFVARIGAGIAGATISTAQAYIADCTTKENRSRGMALIGMAFGIGFTFGPLLGLLAVPDEHSKPGPWPGYAAAGLSAVALLLAAARLPESRRSDVSAGHRAGWSDWAAAFRIPSVALVIMSLFVCVFSFANFETTLSLLIKEGTVTIQSPFKFTYRQVCLTYAFIGLMLALVQGGVVRRLAGRVSEGALASSGTVFEIMGFGLMIPAIQSGSTPLLFTSLGIVVAGFALMQPSLNGMLSRRTDPARQGLVLGVGQSATAMARIIGSGLGIPLLGMQLELPYYVAVALMGLGLVLITTASRGGADYVEPKSA